MRVCDITQAYQPSSGGIKTYLEEKREYVRQGGEHEHVLIVPARRDFLRIEPRLVTVGIAGPPVPGCRPYRFIARIDKVVRALAGVKPDVIELGTPYLYPVSALRHRQRHGTALVAFYHTDFPTAYVEPIGRRLGGRRLARGSRHVASSYMRGILRRMDATLTGSRRLARKLTRWGAPRACHLPLGVDLDTFSPVRRRIAVRRQLGIRDDELILVSAGRMDSEKRTDVLAQEFLRLPHTLKVRLALLGEGPLRPKLEEMAARDPRIVLLPYESDRVRLATLLASSDVYVSAAPHETFGLSVVEAQACGLPVVGVRAGAMVERVTESVGLLAPADRPGALADRMYQLCADGHRQKGMNARLLVEREFSWTRTFERLFETYRTAIDARAARV